MSGNFQENLMGKKWHTDQFVSGEKLFKRCQKPVALAVFMNSIEIFD